MLENNKLTSSGSGGKCFDGPDPLLTYTSPS